MTKSRLPNVTLRSHPDIRAVSPSRRWQRGLAGVFMTAVTVLGVGACLARDPATSSPRTTNTFAEQVRVSAPNKIDLLFMIDNSVSMADKQKILQDAVPDLLNRLINPQCVDDKDLPAPSNVAKDAQGNCPAPYASEFNPIRDIHIGVLSSSLGGHGTARCESVGSTDNPTQNDRGRLLSRVKTAPDGTSDGKYTALAAASSGFLVWAPGAIQPGTAAYGNLEKELADNFKPLVAGVDQIGCGFEASMEAWYRFLVDPSPPKNITQVTETSPVVTSDGIDEVVLKQRADFLRPDSLVAVVNLSDENDCSVIDGAFPDGVRDEFGKVSQWPDRYKTNKAGKIESGPTSQSFLVLNDATLYPGTAACKDNPYSPDCKSCAVLAVLKEDAAAAERAGCPVEGGVVKSERDSEINNRCWNQRQRYGFDALYPLQRYVDGLRSDKIYDTNGAIRTDKKDDPEWRKLYLAPGSNGSDASVAPKVQNPLFDDLQYKQTMNPKSAPRDPNVVFFVGIVGVPWQDLARNQDVTNLQQNPFPLDSDDRAKRGFRSTTGTAGDANDPAVDWDLILGDPFALKNPSKAPVAPSDPLMIESDVPRTTLPADKLKLVTGESLSATSWNSVNGHEWNTKWDNSGDLQYACIFPLPTDNTGTDAKTNDCTRIGAKIGDAKNPLCETYADGDARKKGTGSYPITPSQARAKAYPGTRFLQVARDLGGSGVVASICPATLSDDARIQNKLSYGYRPAVAAIIDRLKTQLTGRCLPRKLAPNPDQTTPCLIIDARFSTNDDGSSSANENQISECGACNGAARRPLDPDVKGSLPASVLKYECLCEVTQLQGNDLTTCQSDNRKAELIPNVTGWCYVDPSVLTDPQAQAGAKEIVNKCPPNEQRTLRFLNTGTDNTTLFITCLGAASGTEQVVSNGDGTTTTEGQGGKAPGQ